MPGIVEFRCSRSLEVFYSGGDVAIDSKGDTLFTACSNVVKVISTEDGSEKFTIGDLEAEDRVTSFCLSHDDSEIVVTYISDLVKRFSLANNTVTLLNQFRATHNAPILVSRFSPSSSLLATGSSDHTVKIWDMKAQYCTHTLRGNLVVSALCFVGDNRLLVGYVEGDVRLFELSQKQKGAPVVEWKNHTSHISAILPITIGKSCGAIVASRDRTISIVNVDTQEKLKVVPIFEPIEDAVLLTNGQLLTVGEEGSLKSWEYLTGKLVLKKQLISKQIDRVFYSASASRIVCVTCDHNILCVDEESKRITRQFAGFNDEIFDVCHVSAASNCLAAATNSNELRLYDLSSFSCQLIEGKQSLVTHCAYTLPSGHTASILSVDSPRWDDWLLASSSKDNSVIIWRINKPDDDGPELKTISKVGVATGHTGAVSSVRFSSAKTDGFIVTVSYDSTLKLWPLKGLPKTLVEEPHKLTSAATFIAHQKDISCLDVSANDKLCITGSMDKTAKLWHINKQKMELGIAGTLRGHKRGVWGAKFATNEQTVATCSGDFTVKLFSLSDFSCLKTFSGHSFAVLTVDFYDKGSKLITTDSGGLLKVWDVRTGACDKTMEAHDEKIWSAEVLVGKDEEKTKVITAGGDGRIRIWEDVSEEVEEEDAKKQAERTANLQTLSNYIQQEKFADALTLTLDLSQPYQCLMVVNKIIERKSAAELIPICRELDQIQLSSLLDYASQWNTNTRTSTASQQVLNCVLRSLPPDELLKLPNIGSIVKSFLPYTNRHFERLSSLKANATYLNYVLSRMRLS